MYKSVHHKEKYQKGTYCSIGNFYICETNMLLLSSSTDNWDIYSKKKNKEHNTLKYCLEIGLFILSSVSGQYVQQCLTKQDPLPSLYFATH